MIHSPHFPISRGMLLCLLLADVVRWKYVEFPSPLLNQLTLDRCYQNNSSSYQISLIWPLSISSSLCLAMQDWFREIYCNLSFAFFSSIRLLPNFFMFQYIRCRQQFICSPLSVHATFITTSHSGLSIHISSNWNILLLRLVSPIVSKIVGEWSDPIASHLCMWNLGNFMPNTSLREYEVCPFAPKSSIWISSIIELKASINLCDSLLPPSFSWCWLISLKSPRNIKILDLPRPKFRSSFHRECRRLASTSAYIHVTHISLFYWFNLISQSIRLWVTVIIRTSISSFHHRGNPREISWGSAQYSFFIPICFHILSHKVLLFILPLLSI